MKTYAETNTPKQSRIPLSQGTPHFVTPSMEEVLASRRLHSVEVQHQPASDSPLQYAPGIDNPKVAQLLSVQIRSTEGRITQVIIRGRPPHVHRDSMGDHITAFAAHAEAIHIALTNQTPNEAIAYIEHITGSLEMFHTDLLAQVPERMVAFEEEVNRVEETLTQITEAPDLDSQIDLLQQAITAYLNARELIPFNTVNVAYLSARAGKGHGESHPLQWLSMFERGECAEMEDAVKMPMIMEAAIQLLDIHAVMLLALEEDPEIRTELTAGIHIDNLSWEEWYTLLVEMHFNTLCALFPRVIAPCLKENQADFYNKALEAFHAEGQKTAQYLTEEIGRVERLAQNMIDRVGRILPSTPQTEQLKEALTIYNEEFEIINHLNRLHTWIPILMRTEVDQVTEFALTIRRDLLSVTQAAGISPSALIQALRSSTKTTGKTREHLLLLITLGEPLLNPELLRFREESETEAIEDIPSIQLEEEPELSPEEEDICDSEWLPEEESTDESDEWESMKEEKQMVLPKGMPTLISQTPSMSIQLLLEDGVIREMRSDDRPPSPYSNTMGAHTTAWAVHLDRVRRLIVGLNPENALACLCERVQTELIEIQEIIAAASKEDRSTTQWENQREQLTTLLNHMDASIQTDGFLSALQDFIYTMLATLNLRPGVSVDKSNTRGHGEGTAHSLLYQAEWYDPLNDITPKRLEQLQAAIKHLFDGAVREDNERYIQHQTWIMEAYPRVCTALNGNNPDPPAFEAETETANESLLSHAANQTAEAAAEAGSPDDTSPAMSEESILMSTNNCLIHAIHEANDGNRATVQEIIAVRQALNIAPGEPIAADQGNLTTILTTLGIHAHVIVGTPTNNGRRMDVDEGGTANAPILLIRFDPRIRHFTPVQMATPFPSI